MAADVNGRSALGGLVRRIRHFDDRYPSLPDESIRAFRRIPLPTGRIKLTGFDLAGFGGANTAYCSI
jgi:hypothetical protein